jgi:hypothetical protein
VSADNSKFEPKKQKLAVLFLLVYAVLDGVHKMFYGFLFVYFSTLRMHAVYPSEMSLNLSRIERSAEGNVHHFQFRYERNMHTRLYLQCSNVAEYAVAETVEGQQLV